MAKSGADERGPGLAVAGASTAGEITLAVTVELRLVPHLSDP